MADGRSLFATTYTSVEEREVRIFRLLPTGAPDPSFGVGGGDGLARLISPDDWNPSPVAVGRNATQDGGNAFAVVRLKNALIFTDGFEGGTTPRR